MKRRLQKLAGGAHSWAGREPHLVAGGEGGQPGERLLPRAADAHQQGMAQPHPDGAVHARQVLQRVVEENQVHFGVAFVVLLENFLNLKKKRNSKGRWVSRDRLSPPVREGLRTEERCFPMSKPLKSLSRLGLWDAKLSVCNLVFDWLVCDGLAASQCRMQGSTHQLR